MQVRQGDLTSGCIHPSVAALIAWFLWLRFCRKLVDKRGAGHLTALPGIATSFKPQDWFMRLPSFLGGQLHFLPPTGEVRGARD
ncbi:hypothetical protein [Streptomyces sp. SS52]|uniref:hypothetical protein n=1 Tax=Streptomyces sp. SS52 TaxID=2563602 RepID=UPI00109E85CB|nr:hypothetical protein [Streptomyces sp. SS52]QCB22176.1 hypothetical protein E5N77_10355 [Streptomyces sp. SS52]